MRSRASRPAASTLGRAAPKRESVHTTSRASTAVAEIPSPFSAEFLGGTTTLHWGASSELDFLEYRLYRGITPGFVPGTGNLVVAKPDTGYVDAAGQPYYYKLSAVDVHGNESDFALVLPDGTTDVTPGATPAALWLAPPQPNPARGSGTIIRFALPQSQQVELAIYNMAGQKVINLVSGHRSAGAYTMHWDGRDAHQRALASGLYLYRLQAGAQIQTRKLLLLR